MFLHILDAMKYRYYYDFGVCIPKQILLLCNSICWCDSFTVHVGLNENNQQLWDQPVMYYSL